MGTQRARRALWPLAMLATLMFATMVATAALANEHPAEEQGDARSDPDGASNGGVDQPGGSGGVDETDQDGNNGCGNDDDREDDNNGNCGGSSQGEQSDGEVGESDDEASSRATIAIDGNAVTVSSTKDLSFVAVVLVTGSQHDVKNAGTAYEASFDADIAFVTAKAGVTIETEHAAAVTGDSGGAVTGGDTGNETVGGESGDGPAGPNGDIDGRDGEGPSGDRPVTPRTEPEPAAVLGISFARPAAAPAGQDADDGTAGAVAAQDAERDAVAAAAQQPSDEDRAQQAGSLAMTGLPIAALAVGGFRSLIAGAALRRRS